MVQRGVFLASIAVVGMLIGVGVSAQPAGAVAVADTCFTVSGGTITDYDAVNCALNPDIPATIGGTPITTIGISAFRDKGLTGVTFLGSNLTTIDTDAFYGNSLGALTLPNSVTTLGDGTFMRAGLTSLTLSTGLTTISDRAFYVNNLTSITLHEGITHIGFSAFSINDLTSVTLPSTVTTIDFAAFGDNKLTSISLNSGLTTIGNGAFATNQLASVTIPNSVTTLGRNTFIQNQLTSVKIGSGVSYLDDGVFSGNKLVAVSIPATVTGINDDAFTGQNPWGGDWQASSSEPALTNATWFVRLMLADASNPHGLHDYISDAPEYFYGEGIWLPGGHLINATPVTTNHLDASGGTLQASSTKTSSTTTDYTIGQNPALDPTIYYRLGDTVTLTPPAIAGYTTPDPVSFTIGATSAAHDFVYTQANTTTPASLAATGSSTVSIATAAAGLLTAASVVLLARSRYARR